ncbi:DUF3850 domain-containing protein [Flavobacterium facile]|uniref:DUF3850 domain-containing protein n=1 Tax=Flavobacterium facile TaxID=2893174 RepID=UPI002E7924FC|nr:DUF3850 domain-containing protein [Flavobacterium sp. T-12]
MEKILLNALKIYLSKKGNKIHNLKIKEEYAKAYFNGLKQWEIRKNDRDFKVGDIIEFNVIDKDIIYRREIIYLLEGGQFGIEKGYCILSLSGYEYIL